jgi:hypothetical protein
MKLRMITRKHISRSAYIFMPVPFMTKDCLVAETIDSRVWILEKEHVSKLLFIKSNVMEIRIWFLLFNYVHITSDYTLLTLYRSYFQGISANIELQVSSVTYCWPYVRSVTHPGYHKLSKKSIKFVPCTKVRKLKIDWINLTVWCNPIYGCLYAFIITHVLLQLIFKFK